MTQREWPTNLGNINEVSMDDTSGADSSAESERGEFSDKEPLKIPHQNEDEKKFVEI